jgi:hypothetical protein
MPRHDFPRNQPYPHWICKFFVTPGKRSKNYLIRVRKMVPISEGSDVGGIHIAFIPAAQN